MWNLLRLANSMKLLSSEMAEQISDELTDELTQKAGACAPGRTTMSNLKSTAGHRTPKLNCSAKPMTAEQSENWRKILCGKIGPYALLMPDTEIQKMRDTLQARVDEMPNDQVEFQEGSE